MAGGEERVGTSPGPCSPGTGKGPSKWTEKQPPERQGENREPLRVAGLSLWALG